MEIIGLYQRQATDSAISIRFPWYVRVVICVMIAGSIFVLGMTLLAQGEIANPFAAYSDLFSDAARQAALTQGFACVTPGYCARRDAKGAFSGIMLRWTGERVSEIDFSMRDKALSSGDLVLLWGRPEIRLYCETAVAAWPDRHITSLLSPSQNGGVSYFSPVVSVRFQHSGLSLGAPVLRNDMLHHCRGITVALGVRPEL